MTLVDIKNALLTYFLSSSTFDLNVDLVKFRLSPGAEVDEGIVDNLAGIVTLGLEDLGRSGIVARVKEGFYILNQPVTSLTQSVILSPYTAMLTADLVNGWSEKTGEMKETGYVVNKLALTDRDVNALAQICAMLLSRGDELMDQDDEEEEQG